MFAEKLKELRKEHNITQVKFAEIFNISSGTIAMWETGKRTPDIGTIQRIAKYFGVSVDWLTGNSEYKHIKNSNEDNIIDNVYFSFAKQAQDEGIDPEDIKKAIEIIKSLKSKDGGE